jgi:hypothetical protein
MAGCGEYVPSETISPVNWKLAAFSRLPVLKQQKGVQKMAYYFVRAKPRAERMEELRRQLEHKAFVDLRPFGKALTHSLENARIESDGSAVWEEEDYCSPPLAEERAAVLDLYFDQITVQPVNADEGWKQIRELPKLNTTA